jgi:hypothetical protein
VPMSSSVHRGAWWELMAECARVAPGKEVHELDELDEQEINESLRLTLRLYEEALARAIERGEPKPDAIARAEVFGPRA